MTTPDILTAAALLKAGKLVAFPTETVYGLGADAANKEAVLRIFAAKKRPKNHPLIVHIADIKQLSLFARDISEDAMKLAMAFWPGPLTLVLPKQPHVLPEITGNQETIAVRIPRHPIAKALLEAFQGGIAAPSANQFTHVSPTTAGAVFKELGQEVDMILDGGACEVGLESTIIDLSKGTPRILRPGMISALQLSHCLGKEVHYLNEVSTTRAPGMHTLHYAPSTHTELLSATEIESRMQQHHDATALITHITPSKPLPAWLKVFSMSNQPEQYAHDLYHTLRMADQAGFSHIWIQTVPSDPTWDAIRDRIQKASGKKNA